MSYSLNHSISLSRDSATRAEQSIHLVGATLTPPGTSSIAWILELSFTAPVLTGAGRLTIRDEAGTSVYADVIESNPHMTISGNKVVIRLTTLLAYSTHFAISVTDGFVKGVAGGSFGNAMLSVESLQSPFPITLVGTEGMDDLRGGDANDQLSGLGGDDKLDGYRGSDVLDGGDGNDHLYAADGNDILRGGNGNDQLWAGWGGPGSLGPSLLEGGAGNDVLFGGSAGDTLDGGSGNDAINVSSWNSAVQPVTVRGGDGDDQIAVFVDDGGRVYASGGAGIDTFTLYPGGPHGVLLISDFVAGAGGDRLNLVQLMGAKLEQGNPFGALGYLRMLQQGTDTVLQLDADGAAGSLSSFSTVLTLAGVSLANITQDNITAGLKLSGAEGGLDISGTAGNDYLVGDALTDVLRGEDGNDELRGAGGHDMLDGGAGDDVLFGGEGNDLILAYAGDDRLFGDSGNDYLDGGDGDDQLYDEFGNNTLLGGEGNDYLVSSGVGINRLAGGAGNDILISGPGNNILLGGSGHDTFWTIMPDISLVPGVTHAIVIDAGDDSDRIDVSFRPGDHMSVTATGGGGGDVFYMNASVRTGEYVITDFAVGSGGDVLFVASLLNGSGADPFDPLLGPLQLVQRGADTALQYRDGTEFRDLVVLRGVSKASLTADNFAKIFAPSTTGDEVLLTGGPGNDTLSGDYADDVLFGGGGADTLYGFAGNDTLNGGDGNDVLMGGSGHNTLIGGAGLDTAHYNWARHSSVWRENDVWHVEQFGSLYGSADSFDLLAGVERLQFADRAYALDIDGTGGKVYRLYQAAFDRTPDKSGVGFWMAKVDQGVPMAQVLDFFVHSPEFATLYGAAPSNAALVSRFYANVLHREADAVGKAFWINVLDSHKASVADVLSHFAESPENQAAVAIVIGNGFEYQPYL